MKRAQTREEWIHDVSWRWDGSASTHGRAGSRAKFKAFTLTMTHNPTGVRVMSSTRYVQNKRELTGKLSGKLWMDLFTELQQELAKRSLVPK